MRVNVHHEVFTTCPSPEKISKKNSDDYFTPHFAARSLNLIHYPRCNTLVSISCPIMSLIDETLTIGQYMSDFLAYR